MEVTDAHVHLASPHLPNPWADGDLNVYAGATYPGRAVSVSRTGGDLLEARLQSEYDDAILNEVQLAPRLALPNVDSCCGGGDHVDGGFRYNSDDGDNGGSEGAQTDVDGVRADTSVGATPTPVKVSRFVFVECCNEPPLDEARWALSLADAPDSRCAAVVARIPAFDGADAVRGFLDALRIRDKTTTASAGKDCNSTESGSLPPALKGGRVVMLGTPMPPPDHCLTCEGFDAALGVLAAEGLHWEWCCHYSALPSVATCCARHPDMIFILDHLGRNGGTENDVGAWRAALAEVARCPNVYAKTGAIEEWGVKDPAPILDTAIELFGFDRLIWESNWFVSKACGFTVAELITVAEAACARACATAEDRANWFGGNAARAYRLG